MHRVVNKIEGGCLKGEKSESLSMNHKLRSAHPRCGVRKSDRAVMTTASVHWLQREE